MDYHLKPIGRTCAATGKELEPGTLCHSVLVEREGRLERLDFSDEAWSGPPDDALAHWTCIVPEQAEERPAKLDPEALLRYFEQLSEDPNPAEEKLRYVLALWLLQKRRLVLDGSREEDGIEYLQLSGSRGEGPFEVRDQHLTDEEIATLEKDLNTHLRTEWV